MCAICGVREKLEMYYIKPIKKGLKNESKSYKKFDKLITVLKRKKLCVCQTCHKKINEGSYNNIKLKDLIGMRIAVSKLFFHKKTNSKQIKINKITKTNTNIIINENNKTYFNQELNDYYCKKGK